MKNSLFNTRDISEGGSLGISHSSGPMFAVKKDGAVFIYRNSCPHLGIELEWNEHDFLDPGGTLIQCSTHGALFIIEDGRCVAGPCQGQYLQKVEFVSDNEGNISIFD